MTLTQGVGAGMTILQGSRGRDDHPTRGVGAGMTLTQGVGAGMTLLQGESGQG